jgi:GMP synthase-like glutamine amidotransferase
MILVVDLCYRSCSLSAFEFVDPIGQIVRETGREHCVRHYTKVDAGTVDNADAVILCGTALKDNAYIDRIAMFSWIRECERPVLGICAGMQVIGLAFGGELVRTPEIGMTAVRVSRDDPLFAGTASFAAYELHTFALDPPGELEVLAVSDVCVQAVRHRDLPVAGVMFHPEVRNPWAVKRFLEHSRG